MGQITIEEISNHLLTYLQRVQAGESFVVMSQGKPIAELKPTENLGLSNAIDQLRQICQEEDYTFEVLPGIDHSNQGSSTKSVRGNK